MKKYQTTFKINKENKIVIKLTSPANKLDYGDWAHVILKTKNQSYRILNYDTALDCFRSLFSIIEAIIEKKRNFHYLIKEDLGLLWNEICKGKRPAFPFTLVEGREAWVGLYHFLWSNPAKVSAWLFKKDKKIYLEITPTYPWLFRKPKPKDNFYTFDEFIKNYKPLIMLEVEPAVVQKWYRKVEKILADMEHNDDTLREAYYKNLHQQKP